jgi:hypothetical protein
VVEIGLLKSQLDLKIVNAENEAQARVEESARKHTAQSQKISIPINRCGERKASLMR